MFKGFITSLLLIKDSIKIFNHYPEFILPLLITWIIYTHIALCLVYWIDWSYFSLLQILIIIFSSIFIFALLLSLSCAILLELIKQVESNQPVDIFKAVGRTFFYNFKVILPIAFIWSVVWFILLIIQALINCSQGKGRRRNQRSSFSMKNATRTLSGYDTSFSWSNLFINGLMKGFRMIIFLILPAVVWERMSFGRAVKRGLSIFKRNIYVFSGGFMLTWIFTLIIFIPPAILISLSDRLEGDGIVFPDWVWLITIIYILFAWSYSIYLEQMFTAELYLWNYKWEKEVKKAKEKGEIPPTIHQVTTPSLLDDAHDLIEEYYKESNIGL